MVQGKIVNSKRKIVKKVNSAIVPDIIIYQEHDTASLRDTSNNCDHQKNVLLFWRIITWSRMFQMNS